MNPDKILSSSDCKRLMSVDVELWSDQDLSLFLVWDFFNTFSKTPGIGKNILQSCIRDTKISVEKYKKYQAIFNLLDWILLRFTPLLRAVSKIFTKHNQPPKFFLFHGFNFAYIISETEKNNAVGFSACGIRDRMHMIKKLTSYVGTNEFSRDILNYLESSDAKYLRTLVKRIESRLKLIKPDYIVLSDDSPPIERAIILACRKLGIITIVIQHGIYAQTTDSAKGEPIALPPVEGKIADYALLWGKYWKDLWIEHNIKNPENIYVLGYPYLIKQNSCIKKENNNYTVCFVAQDYERYNADLLEVKIEAVKKIFKACEKLGLRFIYRPHRGERREMIIEKLPGVEFTPRGESLEESFERADVFISFSSSALIEAAMRQKIALQLMDFPIKLDNFERLGVCNKSFGATEELENYLTEIADSPDLDEFKIKFNNDYIETRHNPAQRFLEIIGGLDATKKHADKIIFKQRGF